MELVITRGNDDPYHQDVKTAAEVYRMNGRGLRVMFDLGAKADGTSDRVFKMGRRARKMVLSGTSRITSSLG